MKASVFVFATLILSAVCTPVSAFEASGIGSYSYVTNGLVALWDAKDNAGYGNHSSDAAAWTDLVGGRQFLLDGLLWGDDYLQFDGNASHYGELSPADTAAVFGASDKTVEFVTPATEGNSSSRIVLKAPFSTGVAFGFSWQNVIFASASANRKTWQFAPGSNWNASSNVTFSADYQDNVIESALIDNTERSGGSQDYWGQDVSSTFLGKRGTGNNDCPFSGRLACIRAYSRLLTADEKSWNYAVDQVRFQGADPNSFEVFQNNDFAPLVNAGAPVMSVMDVRSFPGGISVEVKVTSMGEGSASAKINVWAASIGDEFGVPVKKSIANVGTYTVYVRDLKGGNDCRYRVSVESENHCFSDTAEGELFVVGAKLFVDSKSYIQNGLLANWDGIDNSGFGRHEDEISAWIDLVAGREMALTGTETYSDSIYFTGAAGSPYSYGEISAGDTAATFEATAAKTLQLRIRNTANQASIWLKSTYGAGVAFGYDQSRLISVSNPGTARQTFGLVSANQVTNMNCWTVVYDSGTLPVSAYYGADEVDKLASGQWDYWGQEVASTCVGRRHAGTNSPFPSQGYMSALRLYGRGLSEDEIAWNDAVDRVRFEGADPAHEPIFLLDLEPIRVPDPPMATVIFFK